MQRKVKERESLEEKRKPNKWEYLLDYLFACPSPDGSLPTENCSLKIFQKEFDKSISNAHYRNSNSSKVDSNFFFSFMW